MPLLDFTAFVGEVDVLRTKSGSVLPDGVMTTGSKLRIEGSAYRAAIRWFPQSELAIRRLINQSETFRDICGELAEAEMVLSTVSAATCEGYETHKQEWQELVDRLVGEMAASLCGAKHEKASQDHRLRGAREEEQR